MAELRYEAPESVAAAVKLLAGSKGLAKVLAGGTDLLVQMRGETVQPNLVVDIKKIPDVMAIKADKNGFTIGAAVSGAQLGEHAKLVAAYPGVVEGAELIGSTQVQGRASLGGNLCNASPAADSVPALMAAGAIATVAGPKGRRKIPVAKFTTGPGKTALAKGEFVVSIFLPKRPAHAADAYLRFIPRTEMDIAVAGAAANLVLDAKGKIKNATVAIGAVGPRALIVPAAGKALIGSSLDADALQKMEAAASAAASPIDDKRGTVEFRTKVVGVLARRAAEIAYERARNK
jgi:carbon-monoxide dehydrogenase medium subunit